MNIKNFIISAIIGAAACFSGCKQSEFDYKLVEISAEDVSAINFFTGSDMLIADGKATLKFIVETSKTIKNADGTTGTQIFDYRKLPAGTVKIYEQTTNKEVGFTFNTSTAVAGTKLKFYAQVGTVKSPVKEVTIRATPPMLPTLYVDVIFHVWELNPTNAAYDPSSFQPTNYEDIVNGLKTMNDIINNKVGNAPNGAAANIVFRLATKNVAGQTLQFPGYDRIVYSDEVKTNPLLVPINPNDFTGFINKQTPVNMAKYIWNPKSYLNINVFPFGAGTSLSALPPAKQLAPGPGEVSIPGIAGTAINDDDFVTTTQAQYTTALMHHTVFRPGFERRIEIFNAIGNFYGLYSTATTPTDHCQDTPQASSSDITTTIQTAINGEKFFLENAMDDIRYPSSHNSLTLDQVNRMRAVMLRCPGRMNSKTQ